MLVCVYQDEVPKQGQGLPLPLLLLTPVLVVVIVPPPLSLYQALRCAQGTVFSGSSFSAMAIRNNDGIQYAQCRHCALPCYSKGAQGEPYGSRYPQGRKNDRYFNCALGTGRGVSRAQCVFLILLCE